jgi:hypothetical protein
MIKNNRFVAASLVLLALFWPLYFLMPQTAVPYILDFINALGFTVGIPVLWRYGPGAGLAIHKVLIKRCQLTKGPLLVLGIELTWFAMVLRTLLIWSWRYGLEPSGGLDNAGMAFAALLMIPGGSCHLLASAMPYDNVQIPKLGASMLAGAIACGIALGTIIAFLRWSM